MYLYPTNSIHPFFYICDSYSIAKYQITHKFHLVIDLISAENRYVLNLDKIKAGTEDALKEIEENPLTVVDDENQIIDI